ncbi:MAG: hypothetical protein A3K68_01030 [Euryarchaeota archaeon RBG_16_68_13]|nr:MAG: hypothetical protein A3K68_01030 [Euryarchaeota archaeon RBG_16_68_13]
MTDLLASPFVVFVLALAVGYGMYAWSRRVAPPSTNSTAKLMPYVGGEPVVGEMIQPGYQFYYVALFFTLLHVAALVLATMPSGLLPWAATAYLGMVALAVMILRWK